VNRTNGIDFNLIGFLLFHRRLDFFDFSLNAIKTLFQGVETQKQGRQPRGKKEKCHVSFNRTV
jgi:hypothetical protein